MGIGIASFGLNIRQGNFGFAAVDLAGILIDSEAAIIPFVPGGAAATIKLIRVADGVPNSAIGFASGTGKSAFTPDRLQHASRQLSEAGLLPNWSKATGKRFVELGSNIVENPSATFDHTLRGGQRVKGFLGQVDGKNVAIMIYRDGKNQGKVATSVVPSASQLKNWGIGN